MKSFLQEIESKFFELEEQKSPEDIEPSTDAMKKYAQATRDAAAAATEFGDSLTEDQLCEMCGEIHEGDCSLHNEEHLCEKCGQKAHEGHCSSHNEEHVDEANVTGMMDGGSGPPKSPFSFGDADEDTITQGGYSKVQEAMDRKYEQLIESYRQFSRGDKKMTPENKVKRTIQEVAKKLKEIETLVNHTNKLKTESGMSRKEYGPRTEKALNKISKKLIKIAERVRAIGE